ncbi:hypothetical protein QVD17_07125 [Tagetes erecta]|uniref:Uncharacterized protein n=1 Tax=Tagetes erecta TaxID=13708 RepID=A0AAD8LI94_TARER|nr:hypothetical protein QVD17_07125 [Tagetes erecta]
MKYVTFDCIDMYLLKSESDDVDVVSRSLEPRLDDMNLNLSEEFVVRVLEALNVPGENLISFFKWAAGWNNQEVVIVMKHKALLNTIIF